MADIKLSQLPEAADPVGTEIVPVTQGNRTVGMTINQTRRARSAAAGSENDGNPLLFYTGSGDSYGDGGVFNIFGGDGGLVAEGSYYGGDGGNFNFYGGTAHGVHSQGGYFWVGCGENSDFLGRGGYVTLYAGNSFYGGNAYFYAGNGAFGGRTKLYAGYGAAGGGDLKIRSGGSALYSNETHAGDIGIYAGNGYFGGNLKLQSGDGYTADPGFISIAAGGGRNGNTGGRVGLFAGWSSSGSGGEIFLEAGHSYGESGTGGNVRLAAGQGNTDGLIILENLPTSLPSEPNALWNSEGTLMIS